MESLTILVAGGTGFIGTNLANELQARGHKVWTSDIAPAANANYARADISNYRQVAALFEKASIDHVYHLASEYGRWNGEDYYQNLWKANVIGTKHLLRSDFASVG